MFVNRPHRLPAQPGQAHLDYAASAGSNGYCRTGRSFHLSQRLAVEVFPRTGQPAAEGGESLTTYPRDWWQV